MKYPSHLISLIEFFKKFPGVGQKSAERFAFSLLDWPKEQLSAFGKTITKTPEEIHYCSRCGAMAKDNSCFYCDDTKRECDVICVVAFPKDIFSIEDSHFYNGLYHVLGNVLSPSSGFNHDEIDLEPLKNRLKTLDASELILAFDSTVEGDATTLLLKRELSSSGVKMSRLAFGMPVGSSLEYIDSSTLSRAFAGRQGF